MSSKNKSVCVDEWLVNRLNTRHKAMTRNEAQHKNRRQTGDQKTATVDSLMVALSMQRVSSARRQSGSPYWSLADYQELKHFPSLPDGRRSKTAQTPSSSAATPTHRRPPLTPLTFLSLYLGSRHTHNRGYFFPLFANSSGTSPPSSSCVCRSLVHSTALLSRLSIYSSFSPLFCHV